MIIRLKVESFYELSTDFATIDEAKEAMERSDFSPNRFEETSTFIGHDFYIEDAEAHRNLHNYTQVDL